VDILARLDVATEALLEQNRQLKAENSVLETEKQTWQDDRTHLLSELVHPAQSGIGKSGLSGCPFC